MTPKKKPLYEGKMWAVMSPEGKLISKNLDYFDPWLSGRRVSTASWFGKPIRVLVTITPIVKGKGKR
jgi:hypothetical protein